MYFVGQFDGHKFTCDTAPNDVKWLDWGKDHYATVTYSNTPGRVIAMPWMSNWQYANLTPTQQFRSQNALPRELKLYTADNGEQLVSAAPVKETEALRNKATDLGTFEGEKQAKIDNEGAFELDFDLQAGTADKCGVEIANAKGEKVSIYYDVKAQRFVMDRAESGITKFGNKVEPHQLDNAQILKRYKEVTVNYHNAFALGTWAPVPVKADAHHVQIFVDKSSVELFVDGGRIAMTNLVFPNEPYNQLRFFGGKVANAKAYNIK